MAVIRATMTMLRRAASRHATVAVASSRRVMSARYAIAISTAPPWPAASRASTAAAGLGASMNRAKSSRSRV